MRMVTNICYSGGSKGADKLFGELAYSRGHEVVHWSFTNHHVTDNRFAHVLNYAQLLEADKPLKLANTYLQRSFPTRSEYVNNLLRRNWYQVKCADTVYASTPFDDDMKPLGGTAWAIVMTLQQRRNTKIYNFDHSRDKWFHMDSIWKEIELDQIPIPSGKYAGIGSSELPANGAEAIISLYR